MNFIYLILFISLSFAGSPPDCNGLGKILDDYEKDLHKKTISDCSKMKPADLVGQLTILDHEFLNDKMCSQMGNIETQIEKLKADLVILDGIKKLKAVVSVSKEKVEKDTRQKPSQEAGKNFVQSLNTAQSLEVLLSTSLKDGKHLIQKLKEIPENRRLTQKDLTDRINELCSEESREDENACNPKIFSPGSEAANEILSLIKTTDPTIKQIAQWQRMLEIKRKSATPEDSTYSFNQMQKELGFAFEALDQNKVLTKEQLLAIKKLDDFENNSDFSFVKNISEINQKKKHKIYSDQFFLLMGDTKLRQQYEVQSKISVVWENLKHLSPDLSDIQKQACDKSKILFEHAKECSRHLKDVQKKLATKDLKDILSSIDSSISLVDQLQEIEVSCKEELEKTSSLPERCYAHIENDSAKIQDQIMQLNLLKDKIGSENKDLMTYRNFALRKWNENKGCGKVSAPIDFCEESGPSHISKDALLTISDVLNVAIVFTPPTIEDSEVEKLCEDETKPKRSNYESKLCEFFDDTTPEIIETKNHTAPDGPTDAPDGKHTQARIKDAWLQGSANLLSTALRELMPRQSMYQSFRPNPYQYNYNPYYRAAPVLGISDQILFNARYNGAYGFYMPTPGQRPYTSFAPAGNISPYTTTNSRYFNY